MPTYQYIAKDATGAEYRGTYEDVCDVATLRGELSRVGYVLVEASREKDASRRLGRIRPQDIATLAYKLSGMYSAGLSVVQCLRTLESQAENPALRRILTDIQERVEGGATLTKAFEPHQKVFSEFFIGMLEAGETAGKLSESLEMNAVYLEKRARLRNKIRSAFVYPVSVGVICLGILACLMAFVVPVFINLYSKLHVPLPWPTLLLVNISGMMTGWGLLIGGVVACGIWLGARQIDWAALTPWWNRVKLRLPLVGKLNRLILVTRFTRSFAMLNAVGLPIMDALRMAGRIAGSKEMVDVSESLQKATRAGSPVGEALARHDIFPPTIVQMADSGEQVGRLSEMLQKGVDILDRDIEKIIDSLVVKLEPALTLAMGLVIGLVLLGVYLPMFDYMAYVD